LLSDVDCGLLVLTRCRFLRQHNQPNDSVVQDAAAEFALRFSMVGSDIRQSVSSKWQTVRRCVCACMCVDGATFRNSPPLDQYPYGKEEWAVAVYSSKPFALEFHVNFSALNCKQCGWLTFATCR
jgi:hypothetical protein